MLAAGAGVVAAVVRGCPLDGDGAGHPGLFVTGSGFRGIGIPDCIADGRATARAVEQWLQRNPRMESEAARR